MAGISFKVLNVRRRTSTMKSKIPGVPNNITVLDGIEIILDYVPETQQGITPEEEKKVVEFINQRMQRMRASKLPFIILYDEENPSPTTQGDAPENPNGTTTQSENDEASKWKAKYEESETKRRGLQLKVNEYKKKLVKAGIISDESTSTGAEAATSAESGKTSKPSRGKGKD